MKIVKLLSLVLLVSASVLSSTGLLAHTALAVTAPADGAVLNEGPENITLRFTDEVRLLQLSLINSASHAVEINFTPTANADRTFSLMMPTLATDTYTVEWTAMGSDSHRVEGEFSFTVDTAAVESMGEHHNMPAHHDAD
ncbi:MAG: hypothetical protein COA71_11530 [SAR86 cluster bacterium]|uniref:Copper resistance protein C n=1 Tax=SAR86 cluster bacterium TaxID=2030880 RepID=A0A2A5C977_9GAMM|nr:copper resistance protein CopC [bacterium AH-315-I11]MBN4075728.1 copper resistance protein CopC [Gammaproteobacteria bacterium AH-315-E17]PCJ40135.1 MAG: hypothetical protein COA71_11530 [SAR86 cluster bacterium]